MFGRFLVGDVFLNKLYHHIRHMRVYVPRLLLRTQIHLICTFDVPPQSCVMLKPVARSILMDMQARNKVFGIGIFQSIIQLDNRTYRLPAIFILKPLSMLQRIFCHSLNQWNILINESKFIRDNCLILSHQIGTMNFEPLQPIFTEFLTNCKHQNPS